MSPRDPNSATAQSLKRKAAKVTPEGKLFGSGKQDAIPDELRRWIDLVIVPILVEQYQREKEALETPIDG